MSFLFQKLELFGIHFTLGKLDDLTHAIIQDCKRVRRSQTPVALMVVSMQDVVAFRHQPEIATAFKKFAVFTPDGMPIVWLAKLLGFNTERLYGPDIFSAVLAASADQSVRHFFYGTDPKTLQQLKTKIHQHWPQVQIAGIEAPPFRSLTAQEIIEVSEKINATKPDIVWVGLGSTKQILFTAEVKSLLKTHFIIPVGMAFDVLAGTKQQAPPFLQKIGLEWLFRLLYEPTRLWRRYFFSVPLFAFWWCQEFVNKKLNQPKKSSYAKLF